MPQNNILDLLKDKNTFEVIWIFIFTFFLALAKVLYHRVKGMFEILRSVILSMTTGILIGVYLKYIEFDFEIILLGTSLGSALGFYIWDGLMKIGQELPNIFRQMILSYVQDKKNKNK